MDAKDILGLPKSSLSTPQEKKSRPPKDSQRKPDGISREVYALTGGLAPLMPSVDVNLLKKRPPVENEKITWQWLSFTNSARKDNLQLYHWVRVVNGTPPTGDYSFAKFNKSVDVTKYTDEEYEKYLTDPMWSKEETDQLFDLCERFDLRFTVIADRFPSNRTVEELKNRYYTASRAILLSRAPSPDDVSGHLLVKEPYNISQEIERKRALSMVLSQTKHQERRDAEVLAEAKKISESRMAAKAAQEPEIAVTVNNGPEGTERAVASVNAASPSSSVQLPVPGVVPVADYTSTAASLRMLRVYLRTYALDQMVQAASSSAGLRTIKRVEQTLQDLMIRSHAQKYFLKVQKSGTNEHLPPPRPKRKATHPYPQKASKNAPVIAQVTTSLQPSHALPKHGFIRRTDTSSLLRNPVSSAAASSRADNSEQSVGVSRLTKGVLTPWGEAAANNCCSSAESTPRARPTSEMNDQRGHGPSLKGLISDFMDLKVKSNTEPEPDEPNTINTTTTGSNFQDRSSLSSGTTSQATMTFTATWDRTNEQVIS